MVLSGRNDGGDFSWIDLTVTEYSVPCLFQSLSVESQIDPQEDPGLKMSVPSVLFSFVVALVLMLVTLCLRPWQFCHLHRQHINGVSHLLYSLRHGAVVPNMKKVNNPAMASTMVLTTSFSAEESLKSGLSGIAACLDLTYSEIVRPK